MKNSDIRIVITEQIEKLLLICNECIENKPGLHEIENDLLKQLLEFGLMLLKHIIAEKTKQSNGFEIGLKSYKSVGEKSRKYLSIFGELAFKRPGYWSKKSGQVFKLDELVQLPRGNFWSYNIQEMVGANSTETDYRERVRIINRLLNLGLDEKGSQRNTDRLGKEVEQFYDLNAYVDEAEGSHFMCGFDGKGVPKIKPVTSIKDNPKQRLARGEKRGVKQMATVSVIASFEPKPKGFESIILGLMGSEATKKKANKGESKGKTDNRFYKNIHRRGFLADQPKAIEYGILELKSRMKSPKSRFVVPIDAGIGLENKIEEYINLYGLQDQFDGIVLDIVHVSEYVWGAATAIFGEKSELRRPWVRKTLEDLLQGNVDQVINKLKGESDKTNLSENKKEKITKTITYFSNHKHKMNYDWFLKKGYPISSSIVESTCKHLIKDRMEQSGMRWSSVGAQNMMDLRAVKINGDINELMNYIINKDRKVKLIKKAA